MNSMEEDKLYNGRGKFSVKEFADACGTTRDTLYHYEKQGLITPAVDENNHYRYYNSRDFFLFQYIAHLRRLGFSIPQIHEIIGDRSIKRYFDCLDISQKICMEKIESLQTQYATVDKIRSMKQHSSRRVTNKPYMQYRDEEYFYTTPFNGEFHSLEGIAAINAHMRGHAAHSSSFQHVAVFCVEQERLLAQDYQHNAIMTQVEEPETIPKENLYQKPEGLYLSFFFGADLISPDDATRYRCFSAYLDYIHTHNYTVLSDLYCYDLVGPFLTDRPEDFLVEFSVKVE